MKRLSLFNYYCNFLIIIALLMSFKAQGQFYAPDRIVKLKIAEMSGYQLIVKDGKLTGDSVQSVHITYTKNGNQLKTVIGGDTTLHYYNEKGKELKVESYQKGKVTNSNINTYDTTGLLVSRVSDYQNNGKYIYTYKYNKQGRITETNTVDVKKGFTDKVITRYIGGTNKILDVHSETNHGYTKKTANLLSQYNSKKQLVHEINLYYTLSPVKETTKFENRYVYTDTGKIKFAKILKNDTLKDDMEEYYDKRGNLIKSTRMVDGKRMLMTAFTFNSKNQMVKMMQMNGMSVYPLTADGKTYDTAKELVTTYYKDLTYFTYNADGCMSSSAAYRQNVLTAMYKYYYKKQN